MSQDVSDPKRIRERLGLRGSDQVEIAERDGRAPTGMNSFGEGSVLVARPERPAPLTDEIVRETLDRPVIAPEHQRADCPVPRPGTKGTRAAVRRLQPWHPSDRARGCGNLLVLTRLPPPHRIAPVAVHAYLADITSATTWRWMPAHIAA